MKTLKNKINNAMTKAYIRAQIHAANLKKTMKDESGQFVMDHAVQFVLILVLGGIVLVLLKDWLQNTMAPTLKTKIMEFFN